jgi:hypothetical protein
MGVLSKFYSIKGNNKINRILNLPNDHILPQRLPPITFSKTKEILQYPQHKKLPKSINKKDLNIFSVFKQFNSNETINIKQISSYYDISYIIITLTSLSGHSILLTKSDKIFINHKKKKIQTMRNTTKQLIKHDLLNDVYSYLNQSNKSEIEVSINIKNIVVNISICYNKCKYPVYCLYKYPDYLYQCYDTIRMNFREFEKELIEYYWHPKRMDMWMWQADD